MLQQKRIAAIHDISCFGRCSLTVALPIISAAGIEVSVIPTALLSTHTGGIAGYTYRDLSDDMLAIMNHWQSLHLQFDAVYTGFLGSTKQLDIVSKIFDLFATQGQLIIVDPVMADNGLL
jgi:pyridoxine kinase